MMVVNRKRQIWSIATGVFIAAVLISAACVISAIKLQIVDDEIHYERGRKVAYEEVE